jgi:mono/diheme cytochrome c family protein
MNGRLAAVAMIVAVLAGASGAQAASLENGRRIVQRNCAMCHAIGTTGESRRRAAPAFRDLHNRYPIEMLAEALAEGMLTGHPEMPEFKFQPREIDDIIAYLNSIQTHKIAAWSGPHGPRV